MTSRRSPFRSGVIRGTDTTAMSSATPPSGAFTQKIHRQPTVSVSPPPSSGDTTLAMANTEAMGARNLGRSRAGTASATTAWPRTSSPPPAIPCASRSAISCPRSAAKPQRTEASTNAAIDPRYRVRRPRRSPSRPNTGMATVMDSV